MRSHTVAEPSEIRQKVHRMSFRLRRADVTRLLSAVGCPCMHQEYNALRDRNNWHSSQEGKVLRTTKLYFDFNLATDAGNGVSRTQFKRMALVCQKWTADDENAAQTD